MPSLAPSLKGLFASFDFLWPRRNHGIDGWYRAPKDGYSKGHNPGHNGYSHAIDVDVRGINPPWVIDHITQRSDVMFYIIWDVRVWSTVTGWNGHPYHVPEGGSLHKDHMHIEILQTNTAERFGGPWFGASSAPGGTAELSPADQGGVAGLEAVDPRDWRSEVYGIGNQFDWGGWRAGDGADSMRNSRNY